MFKLPADMLFCIYEFDTYKWDCWKQVSSQFLKGGFNRSNCNIQNFMRDQLVRAEKVGGKEYKRKVNNWLKNVDKFEEIHPEEATYLKDDVRNKKINKAIIVRAELARKKQFIHDEKIRRSALIREEMLEMAKMPSKFGIGQIFRLPINQLDGSLYDKHRCINFRIGGITFDYEEEFINLRLFNSIEQNLLRFNREYIKANISTHYRLQWKNGGRHWDQYLCHSEEYLVQRLALAKNFGETNEVVKFVKKDIGVNKLHEIRSVITYATTTRFIPLYR